MTPDSRPFAILNIASSVWKFSNVRNFFGALFQDWKILEVQVPPAPISEKTI